MREGTFFFTQVAGDYEVYQLLKIAVDEYLVASYWPSYEEPKIETIPQLDTRTSCTGIPVPLSSSIQIFGWEELTPEQHREIENFLKIRSSKLSRSNDFSEGFSTAQQLYAQEEFQACIATLTAIAPYNKLYIDLYRLRGLAYYRSGDEFNALYDLNYYLDQFPETDHEILRIVQAIEKNQ